MNARARYLALRVILILSLALAAMSFAKFVFGQVFS